jgi:hypothetical protein
VERRGVLDDLRRLTADVVVRYLLYLVGCVPLALGLVVLVAPWYGTVVASTAWYILAGRVVVRVPVESPRSPEGFWAATADAEDWPDDAETRVSKATESWPNREAVTTARGLLWMVLALVVALSLEPAVDAVARPLAGAVDARELAGTLRVAAWVGGVHATFVVAERLVAQHLPAHAPHLYPDGYLRPLDDADDGE